MEYLVKALTTKEVIAIGLDGDAEVTDLLTGIKYTIRTSAPVNYDHSDWMPRTRADAEALLRAAGGKWSWMPRPCVMRWNGYATAVSVHAYPHDIVLYDPDLAYNVKTSDLISAGVSGSNGGWALGCHMCCHYIDTITMRPASNWTAIMHQAVLDAIVLAGGQAVDPDTPLLMVGSSGDKVRELQALLNTRGAVPQLAVDGGFGPLTQAAVVTFQTKCGLPATGIVDTGTWEKLRSVQDAPPPLPTAKPDDEFIWGYLTGKGLNAHATAGLVGNLYAESGLLANNLQNSLEIPLGYTDAGYTAAVDSGAYTREQFVTDSAGYGLAQWTYWSRKQELYDFAIERGTSIGDLQMQLDFLWMELQGYGKVMSVLKSATSVREASDIILADFENPSAIEQNEVAKAKRASYGQGYYDRFVGGSAAPPPGDPPASFAPYAVQVTGTVLRIRSKPGTDYAIVGEILEIGVFTVIAEADGTGATKWGKLVFTISGNACWISLDYTRRINLLEV